jgi:Tfp pilus assembly protein PilF
MMSKKIETDEKKTKPRGGKTADDFDITTMIDKANQLVEKGKYADAIKQYQKLVASVPDSADTLNNLAVVQLLAGKQDDAMQSIHQALAIDKQNIQAQKTWIQLSMMTGNDLEPALDKLAAIISSNPGDLDAQWMLGQCLVAMNQQVKAREIFSKILEIQPDYEMAKVSLRELLSE